MKNKRLLGTDDTPEVILDKETGEFKISGKSLPENVSEFYAPIIKWIKEYANNPNENTFLDLKMDYFNTASSKKLLDILEAFEQIHIRSSKIYVRWYFQFDDNDMEKAGESFFKIVDVPHELIPYS